MRHIGRISYLAVVMLLGTLIAAGSVLAATVNLAIVDTANQSTDITVAPGSTTPITISITVTGAVTTQAECAESMCGEDPCADDTCPKASFTVFRDYAFDGEFTGSNEETVEVSDQGPGESQTFEIAGTLTVAPNQGEGYYTLATKAFDTTGDLVAGLYSRLTVHVDPNAPADTTGPEIAIATPADGDVYVLNEVVPAVYACTDPSGVDHCTGTVPPGAPVDTSTVGEHAFTVEAADTLGRTTSLELAYRVVYAFSGFFSPVRMDGVNAVKAGRAVPIKFSLSGDQGLGIMVAGYPRSGEVPCGGGEPSDLIEETVSPGASTLSYDASEDQYTYVWKTDKGWSGTCRMLEVQLADGETHTAEFRFR